jgi:hypothetical protein
VLDVLELDPVGPPHEHGERVWSVAHLGHVQPAPVRLVELLLARVDEQGDVVQKRALDVRRSALLESQELVADKQPVSVRFEPELGEARLCALGLRHPQHDVVDVVVDLRLRCGDQPETQSLRALEEDDAVTRSLDLEPGRQRGRCLLEIGDAQHDAVKHAAVALAVGCEERELPAARVRSDEREVVRALDHVHAEVVARKIGERVAVCHPKGDVVESLGLHRPRTVSDRRITECSTFYTAGAIRIVDPMAPGVGGVYHDWIVETGKQPELFLLLAFLGSFGFIRTSAHMIRAQVSWWPGNVEVGGTHVHHLVWGILLLLVIGYAGIAFAPGSPLREILAILFGIGVGLTLDEFALWLNLEDVYWSERGRRSIDAVIVAAGVAGIALLGVRAWIDVADEAAAVVQAAVGIVGSLGLACALVNVTKGKLWTAAIGLVVPIVGPVSALRLAKPSSPWARLYGPGKRARSRARFDEPEGSSDAPVAG